MNTTADQLPLLSQVPASRRDDPPPSHAAEKRVTKNGTRATNQHRVLEGVRRWPGCTSKELAWKLGMDRVEVARRLGTDLKNVHAWQGAQKRCPIGGANAMTWWPSRQAATDSHNGADHAPTSNNA